MPSEGAASTVLACTSGWGEGGSDGAPTVVGAGGRAINAAAEHACLDNGADTPGAPVAALLPPKWPRLKKDMIPVCLPPAPPLALPPLDRLDLLEGVPACAPARDAVRFGDVNCVHAGESALVRAWASPACADSAALSCCR